MFSDPIKIWMSENMLNVIVSFYLEDLKANNQTFFQFPMAQDRDVSLHLQFFIFYFLALFEKKFF